MAPSPILIRNVRPVGFTPNTAPQAATDILVGTDGLIKQVGPSLIASPGAQVIDGGGGYVSPGWTDLHAHVWHGGTDISIKPRHAGLERGVTTIVDAGSAGEATFHGFREYIIEPAPERILAFLNIGSIGLVACNRVSELIDIRSIDIDRTLAVAEANRDLIVGIKCRASHVILGSWGITPVKVAKKVAKILKLPMMIHVGEPPPTYDEILELLRPGDIITHCFNGKAGGSIIEDEDLWDLVSKCADQGIRLDVGHGGASFSFKVAEVAIERGLMPFSISTDLHGHSLNGPVWDMATTMSKLLSVGMPFEAVVTASTTAPMSAVGLKTENLLGIGTKAELTVFDLVGSDLKVRDSQGATATLKEMFEPRWAVMGSNAVRAARHMPKEGTAVVCTCGAHN
ncbi:amidohydrolase/deacetylase family metallohydrolase [Mesorhizobium sp. RP14(2022)]|uniref:Amidohydrolase/deacetylase family metallohydrolase n=1 Tax=Mesorhizobium liriopis TaxID=2953882 RepID=A0ABT1C5Y4_9HYPH|nr:amidohydrolase/deacetylase family metallohydrolase [Mesorhizobium liriopis]MCO6049640.1 amidohydrolase/deacetylase family metallohydrolase [Mesorhizobium liriopis]